MEKERASAHCTRLRHSKEGADQISLHGVLKTLEVGYVLPAPMPPSETRNWYDTMFARIELEIDLEERILMKAKATMVTHTHTNTHAYIIHMHDHAHTRRGKDDYTTKCSLKGVPYLPAL